MSRKAGHFFKVGIPMFSILGVGTFALAKYLDSKYEVAAYNQQAASKIQNKTKDDFNLEEEYEKMKKNVDLSKLEYVKVPDVEVDDEE